MNVLLDECFAPDVADRLGELLPPEWECDSVYEVDTTTGRVAVLKQRFELTSADVLAFENGQQARTLALF